MKSNQYDIEILALAQEPYWPTGRSAVFLKYMYFASKQGIIDAFVYVNPQNKTANDILNKKIQQMANEFGGGNKKRRSRRRVSRRRSCKCCKY